MDSELHGGPLMGYAGAGLARSTPMPGIATEFLFTIALEVPVLALGETPYGARRIARFGGGSFDGPELRGKVLPGGGGWMLLRRDNVLDIEVRICQKLPYALQQIATPATFQTMYSRR